MSKLLKVILFLSLIANFILGVFCMKVNTEYTMYKHFRPDNTVQTVPPLESIR